MVPLLEVCRLLIIFIKDHPNIFPFGAWLPVEIPVPAKCDIGRMKNGLSPAVIYLKVEFRDIFRRKPEDPELVIQAVVVGGKCIRDIGDDENSDAVAKLLPVA